MKIFTFMENQTRNLTTFLVGTVLYVLFYSYIGSIDFNNNYFYKRLFHFFVYIIMADGFSMAIIYKNFYKHTILNEVKETFGSEKIENENNKNENENCENKCNINDDDKNVLDIDSFTKQT